MVSFRRSIEWTVRRAAWGLRDADAAKRAKGTLRSMVEKDAEMASILVSSEPLNVKVITGIYLYTAGKREQLVCPISLRSSPQLFILFPR